MAAVSIEHEFLFQAARAAVDPSAAVNVARAAAIRNWPPVFALATAHGVAPLVFNVLPHLPPGVVSDMDRSALEAQIVGLAAGSLATVSAAHGTLETLRQIGIRAALGAAPDAVLALSGVRGCGLRKAAILIAPADCRAAREALLAAGCREDPSGYADGVGLTFASASGARVVLETSIDGSSPGPVFPPETVLDRAVDSRIAGVSMCALDPQDRLIALCARGMAKGWRRLEFVVAAAALCREPADLSALLEVARRVHLRGAVLTGALLARNFLGIETPLAAAAMRDRPARVGAVLARRVFRRSGHPSRRAPGPASPPVFTPPDAGGPRRLVLRQGQSPGDLVMLTAAVRDLHVLYPGRFVTDVRTPCPDLWQNNPHITPLDDNDPYAEIIECHYPLIHRSNQTPYHFIHGFIEFLNDHLALQIKPTAFNGDIHLSSAERQRSSPVCELTGLDVPYWVVTAGGKYDYTIKWWSHARYQAVLEHFRNRLLFVQVGEAGHHHRPLEGAIDLRGQTSLRELIRLVHHADGVVGPISLLMHLAAAVETRPGAASRRASVVIAGGREPVHFTEYPGHQFLHTIGALPCCDSGGCWKSRTLPIEDGDYKDQPGELCVDVVDGLPHCMDLITADEVIRRIDLYLAGGVARALTAAEGERVQNVVSTRAAIVSNGQRRTPIWCDPVAPLRREPPPPVSICVTTTGDRVEPVRRCLESIRASCMREDYRLVVGAMGISRDVREYLYSARIAGEIDRLHETPIVIADDVMMQRMLADVETEYVWWIGDDSHVVEAGALDHRLGRTRALAFAGDMARHGAGFADHGEGDTGFGPFRGDRGFALTAALREADWSGLPSVSSRTGVSTSEWAPGDVGDHPAFVCEPYRDGVMLAERIEQLRPRRVLLSFRHGLGDLIMFLGPFAALQARYPAIRFVLGVARGMTYEGILDPKSTVSLTGEDVNDKAEALPYDLVVKIVFPMSEGQQEFTKGEWSCLHELGIPPVAVHPPLSRQPSRLVAVHFHTTCLPGSAGADRNAAERVWSDIRAAGCIPLETHFEHVFHNPVNEKFDFIDATVRRCRPEVASLVGLIQTCGAFVGVVSGNFHVALSVLPPERVFLLEKDFKRESFTKLPIATANLRDYRGEVRTWLEALMPRVAGA